MHQHRYKNHTIKAYCDALAQKAPVPGGGSAAAVTAALGAALVSMVARYSTGRGQPVQVERRLTRIIQNSERIRSRLLDLVDLDAVAYREVVKTRQMTGPVRRKALRQARDVPREIGRLCFQVVEMTPILVVKGNRNLISDIEAALELLTAAFRCARVMVAINNP